MTRIDESQNVVVRKARHLIQKENLLQTGDSVVVGLSGGADSVALLLLMLELREEYELKISCAHINHCLRGEDARRDMEFVKELCNRLGIKLFLMQEDVGKYAKEHHLSLEDAGRQIRYRFFREIGCEKIATAHTKDDNAETVLMNLVKGNLPKGILPKRETVIRPLLLVTKEEIYRYLEEKNQAFVTDETNFSTEFIRNRIRLELIPYIKENFNQNFTNTVYNTTDVFHSEQAFLQELCDDFLGKHSKKETDKILLEQEALKEVHPALARKVLRSAWFLLAGQDAAISYEQTERVLGLLDGRQSGKRISLPKDWEAVLCGAFLLLRKQTENVEFSMKLSMGETKTLPFGQEISLSKTPVEDALYCYPVCVKTGEQVWVRNRKPGDKIYFQNLGIHKKLSDFFIDKKVPLYERDEIPLVVVNHEVRAVVGHFYEEVLEKDLACLYYIVIK